MTKQIARRPAMRVRGIVIASALTVVAASRLGAQRCDTTRVTPFVVLGGIAEDQLRRNELAGCARPSTLIRSPLTLSADLMPAAGWRASFEVVSTQMSSTWNSQIPHSMNDGVQWAGRGASGSVLMGVRFRWWRIHGSIVPEAFGSSNALFNFRPASFPGRSPYGNWGNVNLPSIDAPTRFGYRSFAGLTPGQSSLEIRTPPLAAGISTENMWWGPGLRNAIVMSNNAEGIPQAYVRTASPLRTRFGSFEGRAMLGVLSESPYFDSEIRNDRRSLSAVVVSFTPAIDSNLAVGAARAAYGDLRHLTGLSGHALDFVQALPSEKRDEIQSMFARWSFPASGLSVHGEWSRLRIPSLHELLVSPERTQGYTLGLQWSRPVGDGTRRLRLQGETTMLEQPRSTGGGRSPGYYVSRRVAQGYTQRGQVIGAAIGPGGSSQWLGGDLSATKWSAGIELGRIRWDDDAYYTSPTGLYWYTHDVSLSAGLSATRTFDRAAIRFAVVDSYRMNYQNQSGNSGLFWNRAFDVTNYTLNLSAVFRR